MTEADHVYERLGWFADWDPEAAINYAWTPTLQIPGSCPNLPIHFATEKECQDFIHDTILNKPCIDDCHPEDTP